MFYFLLLHLFVYFTLKTMDFDEDKTSEKAYMDGAFECFQYFLFMPSPQVHSFPRVAGEPLLRVNTYVMYHS